MSENNTTAPALTDEQRAAINMAISVLTPLAMDEYGDALRALLTSPRAAVPLQLTDSEKASIDRLTAIACSFPEHIGPSGAWSRVNHGDLGAVVSIAKRALDAAPAAPVADKPAPTLILTGAQLLEALDFIAPDRSADQLESEVSFQHGNGHAGEGMYCWMTEYPDEGAMKIDGSTVDVPVAEYDGNHVQNHCTECNEHEAECTCTAAVAADGAPLDEDLTRLRSIALAATPGPWRWDRESFGLMSGEDFVFWPANAVVDENATDAARIGACGHTTEDRAAQNMAFVEAVNPSAILALIDRVERAARAAVSPATAEPREAGHGIKGIPRAAFGPHTEADRIDHCGSCGAENEPQKDDVCPVCHAECSLVSTWGEFQHTRYRNGQRYANNGPQPWEDGPQPATAEPTDYAAIEREHFGDPDKRTGIYAPATADERHEDGLLTTEALISIIERHFDHDHPDGQRLVEMAQDVAASQHKQGEPATADELAAFLVWWTRDVPEELRRDWINRNEQFLREGKACEALARAWEGWQARASQAAAPAEAIDRYQAVCAAAYQLAGVVGAPLRFLDALSDAANGEPMSADEALNLLPVGLNEIDEVNRSASAPADAREPVAQWQTRVRAAKTAAWVNVTEEDAKHVMSELPEAYEVRALYERPEPADAGEAVSSFIRDVAAQKPVLGSSCGLCDSNRNRAQDLLKAAQGVQGGKGGDRG